jgi:hypothetical protein
MFTLEFPPGVCVLGPVGDPESEFEQLVPISASPMRAETDHVCTGFMDMMFSIQGSGIGGQE